MIEILHWIWEHRNEPITFTLTVSFIVIVLDKLGRRFINNQVKRLFHINDKSEFKQIASNQARIESKVDLLMKERGISWPVDSKNSNASTTKPLSNYSPRSLARAVGSIMKKRAIPEWGSRLRRMKIMSQKFKSRKFWMAVVTAALIIANDGLDLGIEQETVLTFAGLVVTWIIGESAVDAKRSKVEDSNDDTPKLSH